MSPDLRVYKSKKGRGVYAMVPFYKGDTVEISEVIIANQHYTKPNPFDTWTYAFGNKTAIALGFGSLYNHSFNPNVTWECLLRKKRIQYTALRDIKAGEELCINYAEGYKPGEVDLGFKVRK